MDAPNNTTTSDYDDIFITYPSVRMTIFAVYLMQFIFGVLGNISVIVVIGSQRTMRSVTNFLLLNLAIADLLVMFLGCVPMMVRYSHIMKWNLGRVLCHLHLYTLQTCPCVSAAHLILVALERLVAIMHPLSVMARWMRRPRIVGSMAAMAWCFCMVANIPYAYYVRHLHSPVFRLCIRTPDSMGPLGDFSVSSLIMWWVIPSCLLIMVYSRICLHLWQGTRVNPGSLRSSYYRQASKTSNTSRLSYHHRFSLESNDTVRSSMTASIAPLIAQRIRTVKLLTVMTSSFIILTMPHYVRHIFRFKKSLNPMLPYNDAFALIQPASFLMLFCSSAINPYLYAYFSSRFRKALFNLLRLKRKGSNQANSNAKGEEVELQTPLLIRPSLYSPLQRWRHRRDTWRAEYAQKASQKEKNCSRRQSVPVPNGLECGCVSQCAKGTLLRTLTTENTAVLYRNHYVVWNNKTKS